MDNTLIFDKQLESIPIKNNNLFNNNAFPSVVQREENRNPNRDSIQEMLDELNK